MSIKIYALLAIITASLIWSSAGVTSKLLLQVFQPFNLAFLRFFIASIVVLPFLLKQKNLNWKKTIREVVPVSLLGSANIALFFFGLQRTTANSAAIIYTAGPLVTAILAKYLIKEILGFKKIFGILVGLTGVLFIILLPLINRGDLITGGISGNFIIMTAVLVFAFYTVGSKRLINIKQYSPVTVTCIFIIISTIVFLLITLITNGSIFIQPLFNPVVFLQLVHLAVPVTVVTYFLYQWAIQHTSATSVSLTNYLQPVFGIWLNIIILGERIDLSFILGSLLVLTGVFIATGTSLLKVFKNYS